MTYYLLIVGVALASLASLFFSSLTYSLRDYTRARLEALLRQSGKAEYFQPTVERTADLIFVTAIGRMIANLLILIFVLHVFHDTGWNRWMQYLLAVTITAVISAFCSVAIPHAISEHVGEKLISSCVQFLHGWRTVLLPLTGLVRMVDRVVVAVTRPDKASSPDELKEEEIEQDIVSAVEEAEKEGVVDHTERQMIESVIQFRDTHVGQIMSARTEIVALPVDGTLPHIKRMLEESGHSRLPVFEGTLDHIVGILYARDLLKFLGQTQEQFNIRQAMRPPYYVPKTKLLRDLLADFRLQKVHIAIVLDEYGGTAGLITIEDVLEELVGDISDEHEPQEPAMLKRISDTVAEADARVYIDELNRVMGLNLPEGAGFDTLGGFVSTTIGRIPQRGASFEFNNVKYTVLDAEPQKVNRVRIEVLQQAVES